MKTVLITGASGFLGHHLVMSLLDRGDTEVIAILGRPEDNANALPENENLKVYPCSDLFTIVFGHVDTLIHTAFSRGENLPGLTRSIEFTEQIIELVNRKNIDSIINISSQGVYRTQKPGEKVDESGFVEPNTSYGLSKWAVENMLKLGCEKRYTNIRMASLSANARFLDFFVNSVIAGNDIKVTAPNQYASIMDVSDAVDGILRIEYLPTLERDMVYNLGPGEQYSILDYAMTVNEIGCQFGYTPVKVMVEDNGKEFAICMNCNRLISATSWFPRIDKELMIKNLFQSKQNEQIA